MNSFLCDGISVLPVISQVVKAELGEMMSGEISKGLVDSMRSVRRTFISLHQIINTVADHYLRIVHSFSFSLSQASSSDT
jgi:hypothetical protein